MMSHRRLKITGRISGTDGRPMPHLLVRARDVGLDETVSLGESLTDHRGRYRISCSVSDPEESGGVEANVLIEVLTFASESLTKSDVRFGARYRQTINLRIEPPPPITELEQVVGTVRLLIGDRSLSLVGDEEIAFLLGKLKQDPSGSPFAHVVDERRLGVLVESAALAAGTGLPDTFFYAIAQAGRFPLPLTLGVFVELTEQEVEDLLTLAAESRLAPPQSLESVAELLDRARIDEKALLRRRLAGRLLSEDRGTPLARLKVQAVHLDRKADLGSMLTSHDGVFVFHYLSAADTLNHFRLEITDFAGQALRSANVEDDGTVEVVELRVPLPDVPDTSPGLMDVAESLGVEVPRGVPEILEREEIRTLADLRSLGGFGGIEELPTDDPALRRLEAHATLSTLAGYKPAAADSLISAGYDDIVKIAAADRPTFVGEAQPSMGHFRAAGLLKQASLSGAVLRNMLTNSRVDRTAVSGEQGPLLDSVRAELGELFSEDCGCRTCDTIVSPAAYLADLIDYASNHLKDSGVALTIEALEEMLHQPFGELPAACGEVEEELHQIRICIEVLRRYLVAEGLPATDSPSANRLQDNVRRYLETAFSAILRETGTSLDELRGTVLSDDAASIESLAFRLGISGDPSALLIHLDGLSNSDAERELEHVFGLEDTTRDHFATGPVLGDQQGQLKRVELTGVAWDHNTDADGYVYVSLLQPAANVFRVELFRDEARTQLVAAGESGSHDGLVQLISQAPGGEGTTSSGLHGFVRIGFVAADSETKLSAVPLLLSLRLQFLRSLWRSLDVTGTPVLDPDLVSLSHLRVPLGQNPAFAIWKVRQTEVSARFQSLLELGADGPDSDRFAGLLAETGVTLTEDELRPEELAFLLRIQEVIDRPEAVGILDREWTKAVGVLVRVEKSRQSQIWLNEEVQQGILLSPDFFTVPDRSASPSNLVEGLADPADLRRLNNTLRARTEKRRQLVDEFDAISDSTAEAHLHLLRDALLLATEVGGASVASKAGAITDLLLINAQMDGCLRTTRIAQAIETLQLVLFSVRIGQLNDTHPDLELNSTDFDEEWKWLGSYSTWRSAIMVFLFPENVLDPGLRRLQTSAFVALAESLRSRTQLSPEDACREAQKFAAYINDIPALTIEATAQARVPLTEGKCPDNVVGGSTYLTFLFGRAAESGRAYVSTYRSGVATGLEHSFWEPVELLRDVVQIIGASVYEFETDRMQRFLYLFAKTKEELQEKLVFVRYNLETREWEDTGPHELELPVEDTPFSAVIHQQNNCVDPPALALEVNNQVFWRRLNPEGNDFDPTANIGPFNFKGTAVGPPLKLLAMVSLDAFQDQRYHLPQYFLLFGTDGNSIFHKLFAPASHFDFESTYTTTSATKVANGTFLGTVFWPSDPNVVYTFWRQNDQIRYNATFFDETQRNKVFVAPDDPNGTLAGLAGLNQLERIAVHSSAGTLPSLSRQIGFQLAGARPGPFLGIFTRSTEPLDLIAPDTEGVTFMFAGAPGNGAFGVPLLLRIGGGTLIGDDGGVFDPDFPPFDPPEPPDEPEDLPIFEVDRIRLAPHLREPVELVQKQTEAELQIRRARIELAFQDNTDSPRSSMTYLEEAFFFAPVLLALNLQRRGHFVEALDWFRTVFDFTQEEDLRKIYFGLVLEESLPWKYERYAEWLLEPLNPHGIAATRQNTYTRFTLLSLIQCFLDFGDAEFARDTTESIARAHSLYGTALELLGSPELEEVPGACESLIDAVDLDLGGEARTDMPRLVADAWSKAVDRMGLIRDPGSIRSVSDQLRGLIAAEGPVLDRLERAEEVVDRAVQAQPPVADLGSSLRGARQISSRGQEILLRHPDIVATVGAISFAAERDFNYTFTSSTGRATADLEALQLPWLATAAGQVRIDSPVVDNPDARVIPHFGALGRLAKAAPVDVMYGQQAFPISFFLNPSNAFCAPLNPLIESLATHAELNQEKIRTCRNLVGLERPLAPYSATIYVDEDVPVLDRRGSLILPSDPKLAPTVYRFRSLIDRAKNLVGLAQQLEATFLSILEKRDAEFYNLLKARQDINLSLAGVRLRQLGMLEARDNVRLYQLQVERSAFQEEYYEDLTAEATNKAETDAMLGYAIGAGMLIAGIYSSKPDLAKAGATSLVGTVTSTDADQRQEQLRFALQRARKDTQISSQQSQLARDRLRLVGQELRIANLRAGQARETMDFLVNKFTNAELYDWMTRVLEEVYGSFLQQATSVAQLAAHQLAFERQEPMPDFIQADYWEAPLGSHFGGDDGGDRKGLTGSARLLQDIFQLDQYAFDTEQRKQQLSKTISLARMAPAEFQRFRQTGVLDFDTPMVLFDRDFPGHFLRLIRQVRLSVIALIPPTEGIKATLTSSGISRVVTGGEAFRESTIRRSPETLALTSPINSSGRFEFELQQRVELLRPFEGSGVDTDWTFELPKPANQFDFQTIADVLLTIDYTAVARDGYRKQVVEVLGRDFSADRSFSFRHELADQWFDLNNPDQTDTPMTVRFRTERADFLPNLEELQIHHVVFFFATSEGSTFEVDVAHLHFAEAEGDPPIGGGAVSTEGVISTRRGNAPPWVPMIGRSPVGQWELALTDTEDVRNRLQNEEIEDILFVLTYSALTPEWS